MFHDAGPTQVGAGETVCRQRSPLLNRRDHRRVPANDLGIIAAVRTAAQRRLSEYLAGGAKADVLVLPSPLHGQQVVAIPVEMILTILAAHRARRNNIAPERVMTVDATFARSSLSFKKKTPMNRATIMLVSRNAVTRAMSECPELDLKPTEFAMFRNVANGNTSNTESHKKPGSLDAGRGWDRTSDPYDVNVVHQSVQSFVFIVSFNAPAAILPPQYPALLDFLNRVFHVLGADGGVTFHHPQ